MTGRALLKTAISAPLAWSGGASLLGHASGKRKLPLVLGYHRVVDNYNYSSRYAINASLVSVKTLLEQVDWIAQRYEICSLDEIDNRAESRRDKSPAAITFDDGYADVYHNAFPVFKKKGIPFAVFATTDLIGGNEAFAHDELYVRLSILLSEHGSAARLGTMLSRAECWAPISDEFYATSRDAYALTRAMLGAFSQAEIRTIIDILRSHTEIPGSVSEQLRVMDWDMLREMQQSGVLIGCHAKSHAIFTNEEESTMLEEAVAGREALENQLGVPVEHFAYPDGAFNETAVRAVAQAGYSHAYTVCFHRSRTAPHLTVPRRMLWERSNVNILGQFSGAIMTCQVNGVYDRRAACASGHQ